MPSFLRNIMRTVPSALAGAIAGAYLARSAFALCGLGEGSAYFLFLYLGGIMMLFPEDGSLLDPSLLPVAGASLYIVYSVAIWWVYRSKTAGRLAWGVVGAHYLAAFITSSVWGMWAEPVHLMEAWNRAPTQLLASGALFLALNAVAIAAPACCRRGSRRGFPVEI